MLTEMVRMLKNGETRSLQEIADILKTDISVVKAQLEYMENQGYIKKVALEISCSGKNCNACRRGSGVISMPVMWELKK